VLCFTWRDPAYVTVAGINIVHDEELPQHKRFRTNNGISNGENEDKTNHDLDSSRVPTQSISNNNYRSVRTQRWQGREGWRKSLMIFLPSSCAEPKERMFLISSFKREPQKSIAHIMMCDHSRLTLEPDNLSLYIQWSVYRSSSLKDLLIDCMKNRFVSNKEGLRL